jgi:hypothetical protein
MDYGDHAEHDPQEVDVRGAEEREDQSGGQIAHQPDEQARNS